MLAEIKCSVVEALLCVEMIKQSGKTYAFGKVENVMPFTPLTRHHQVRMYEKTVLDCGEKVKILIKHSQKVFTFCTKPTNYYY